MPERGAKHSSSISFVALHVVVVLEKKEFTIPHSCLKPPGTLERDDSTKQRLDKLEKQLMPPSIASLCTECFPTNDPEEYVYSPSRQTYIISFAIQDNIIRQQSNGRTYKSTSPLFVLVTVEVCEYVAVIITVFTLLQWRHGKSAGIALDDTDNDSKNTKSRSKNLHNQNLDE
jgi:hypothetical protein